MNRQEKLSAVLIYALLCGLISILFYRSLPAFLLLLPGYVLFRKLYAERMGVKHQRKIREEFLTGMQFVSTSLCAGYLSKILIKVRIICLRRQNRYFQH